MSIQGIQGYGTTASGYAAYTGAAAKVQEKAASAESTAEDESAKKAVENNGDQFVKSSQGTSGTYTKSAFKKLSGAQADALMAAEEQRQQSFQRMLESMVVKQGKKGNMVLFGKQLNVTNKDIEAAKASIAEGGEYSVDAVAGRILDMAKALAGGDESKIGTLRNAVIKGFKAAGIDMGGKLPDISSQTYDEVMKRFDEWEMEANGLYKTDEADVTDNALKNGAVGA